MTEKLLRDTLKEAQEKNQLGLILWSCWAVWDDLGFELKPGNEHYDFALSQISKNEEATSSVICNGFSMAGFIAVSLEKLNSSDEFFNTILKECEKHHFDGPITLLPLNKLAETC